MSARKKRAVDVAVIPVCGDCRFWAVEVGERVTVHPDTVGQIVRAECRKKAPLPQGYSRGAWPSTDHDDWCGEFERVNKRGRR